MRLRFADEPAGYTPQSDASTAQELANVREYYSRWSAGQLRIHTTTTPTLTLPGTRSSYLGANDGKCHGSFDKIIDDALVAVQKLGINPSLYDTHSVRYDAPNCPSWGSPNRTWLHWDYVAFHEWAHSFGLPNEDVLSSSDANPLSPSLDYIRDNAYSGVHIRDANSVFTVPDLRDLGVLDETNVIHPTTTGIYRIYSHQITDPKNFDPSRKYAIELKDWSGSRNLTFEYHTAVPSIVDTINTQGLIVVDSDSHATIDMTPGSYAHCKNCVEDARDAALRVGRSLTAFDQSWTVLPLTQGIEGGLAYTDVIVDVGD
jgi:hypothetical protein